MHVTRGLPQNKSLGGARANRSSQSSLVVQTARGRCGRAANVLTNEGGAERKRGLRPVRARGVCSAHETAHNPNRFRPDGAGRVGGYRQRCLHAEVAGNEIRSLQAKVGAYLFFLYLPFLSNSKDLEAFALQINQTEAAAPPKGARVGCVGGKHIHVIMERNYATDPLLLFSSSLCPVRGKKGLYEYPRGWG